MSPDHLLALATLVGALLIAAYGWIETVAALHRERHTHETEAAAARAWADRRITELEEALAASRALERQADDRAMSHRADATRLRWELGRLQGAPKLTGVSQ